MESYTIKSFDSYPIAVREFIPNEPLEKIVVISPAVGVPQSFYYNFSNHFRSKGYHVFTFDYRGIGSSKYKSIQSHKNFGFISWAKDFEAELLKLTYIYIVKHEL